MCNNLNIDSKCSKSHIADQTSYFDWTWLSCNPFWFGMNKKSCIWEEEVLSFETKNKILVITKVKKVLPFFFGHNSVFCIVCSLPMPQTFVRVAMGVGLPMPKFCMCRDDTV